MQGPLKFIVNNFRNCHHQFNFVVIFQANKSKYQNNLPPPIFASFSHWFGYTKEKHIDLLTCSMEFRNPIYFSNLYFSSPTEFRHLSVICNVTLTKVISCSIFFNWDSLQARLNNHYGAWSYKKKKHKNHTKLKHRRKLKQRIPESSCARKETVDKDILVISRNGDRKSIQSIRITSRPPSRRRKWKQLSQFRCTSTKVILVEKTFAGYISTMSQEFRRGSK